MPRPILYTDTINGKQVMVDNLWAITTEDLQELKHDALVMANRLIFENDDTFSPETKLVVDKYRKQLKKSSC